MKYAEFNIDHNKIEYFNSNFGMESVLLNGEKISKKFSFSGLKHAIQLGSRNLTLESKYQQFDKHEIELRLLENGNLIDESIVKANKKQRLFWIATGIITGLAGYQLLNFLVGYLN